MDPARLLETTQVGLERELLRSARDEVLPDAVRARVLASLADVLPGGEAPPAMIASSAVPPGLAGACGAVPGARSKLALALKSIHAVYHGVLRSSRCLER